VVDIAIINISDEAAEAIEWALRSAGWTTERASPLDFKRGRLDLADFLTERDPLVLVWDVAIPFDENWAYCQAAQTTPAAEGRQFVVTTNNRRALRKMVGDIPVLEFLATPSDLTSLCSAVRRVWRVRQL
jgi:hypothetical protein